MQYISLRIMRMFQSEPRENLQRSIPGVVLRGPFSHSRYTAFTVVHKLSDSLSSPKVVRRTVIFAKRLLSFMADYGLFCCLGELFSLSFADLNQTTQFIDESPIIDSVMNGRVDLLECVPVTHTRTKSRFWWPHHISYRQAVIGRTEGHVSYGNGTLSFKHSHQGVLESLTYASIV